MPSTRSAGQTVQLSARGLGYEAKSVSVVLNGTAITQDFVLAPTAAQLTGVVVTALSQQREKATIGTSQQDVSGEELTRVQQPNVVSAMSGKVSGLQISQSGNMGGTTRIVIRGAGSILGENQPLFIVDGVPISNVALLGTISHGVGERRRDYGAAISDLNMDDVASVTVLKGPNAAALYGSRASNGASRDHHEERSQPGTRHEGSFTQPSDRRIHRRFFRSTRTSMARASAASSKYVDGQGGGVNDGADESWGPKLDGRPIDQFFGKAQPWVAHPGQREELLPNGLARSPTTSTCRSLVRQCGRAPLDHEGRRPRASSRTARRSASSSARCRRTRRSRRSSSIAGSLSYVQNRGLNRTENGYTEGNPFMRSPGSAARSTSGLLREPVLQQEQPVRPHGRKPVQLERQLSPQSVLAECMRIRRRIRAIASIAQVSARYDVHAVAVRVRRARRSDIVPLHAR